MTTVAELEAYMDKTEERYFVLYPNPEGGPRRQWAENRAYIRRVKSGEIAGVTFDMQTPRAIQSLVGYRRIMGEELHPRKAILRRQEMTRAAAAAREAAPSSSVSTTTAGSRWMMTPAAALPSRRGGRESPNQSGSAVNGSLPGRQTWSFSAPETTKARTRRAFEVAFVLFERRRH
jgi:hypothetical protein